MKRLHSVIPEQVEGLKKLLKGTRNPHEYERGQAILKRIEGYSRETIAEFFDIHLKTLDRWTTAFNRNGVNGIRIKQQRGNHHLLSKRQKEELKQLLLIERKKPEDIGYKGRFWDREKLAQLVRDRYRVIYKSATSYQRLFVFIGFTNHKPIKVNKRRSEAARKRFIEIVKKNLNCTQEQNVWSW